MFEVHKAKKALGQIDAEYATKKAAASGSLSRTYDNIPSLGTNEAGELRMNPDTYAAHDAYRDTMKSLDTARGGAVQDATRHLSPHQFGKLSSGRGVSTANQLAL